MRVVVLGGSFNPPHVGHAMVAAWLKWTNKADEVWLIPAFDHAFDKPLAPFQLRVDACTAMAQAMGPFVRVEPIEATLPVPSYTIQTLDALSARHPTYTFRLVVGADVVETLHLWKDWDRIAARYAPIVVGRVGYPPVEGAPTFPAISSTEIRRRLREGMTVEGYLFPEVARIVSEHASRF